MPSSLPLEICVETPAGLAVAATAGADRVELCSALALGGLTPGAGLLAAAAATDLSCHAMIRPRGGDFILDEADLAACLADIAAVRGAGLAGVVLGAALPDGTLDEASVARMKEAAGPLEVTLHRVFDLTPDPEAALETAIGLGITRILTSGQAAAAPEGVEVLRRLVSRAAGRIEIMAGGGVTPEAAPALIGAGVDALHASCGVARPARGGVARIGIPETQKETDAGAIAALRQAMQAAEAA